MSELKVDSLEVSKLRNQAGSELITINPDASLSFGGEVISSRLNFLNWTTSTRPSNPEVGTTGYNTSLGELEVYNGYIWHSIENEPIVTPDLQIFLDWGNPNCYPGTGIDFCNLRREALNNGYLAGNVVYSPNFGGIMTTGGFNNGVQNNVGDRININTSAAGVDRFGAHDFSIFFWVNQISSSGRIFSTGSAGSGTADACIWQFWIDTGQFYWWNSGGGSAGNITTGGINWHTPGQWELIGFTYEYNSSFSGNNILKCYRNGVEVNEQIRLTSEHNYRDRSTQTDLQYTLGGGYFSSCFTRNSACNFGPFWLYNRGLTASEVLQNFNATRNRFGV